MLPQPYTLATCGQMCTCSVGREQWAVGLFQEMARQAIGVDDELYLDSRGSPGQLCRSLL